MSNINNEKLPEYLEMLKDTREEVRCEAVKKLGELGCSKSIKALGNALQDESALVKMFAINELTRLEDPEIVRYLLKVLFAPDEEEFFKGFARSSLQQVGTMATDIIVEHLGSADKENKIFLMTLLGTFKAIDAIPVLLGMLADNDWNIRQSAIFSLGRIGDVRALPALISALNDSEEMITCAAAESIGKLGNPDGIEPLVNMLETGKPTQKFSAIIALGDIPDSRRINPLINAVREDNATVRNTAIETLIKVGDEAANQLIKTLSDKDSDMRILSANTLGFIKNTSAVSPLLNTLKDPVSNVRYAAAEALGRIGDSGAIEALLGCLDDQDSQVGCAAVDAIALINDKGAVEALLQKFATAGMEVQFFIVKALGTLGGNAAIAKLEELLNDGMFADMAIEALGGAKDESALKILEEILGKNDGAYDHLINEAIAKIKENDRQESGNDSDILSLLNSLISS